MFEPSHPALSRTFSARLVASSPSKRCRSPRNQLLPRVESEQDHGLAVGPRPPPTEFFIASRSAPDGKRTLVRSDALPTRAHAFQAPFDSRSVSHPSRPSPRDSRRTLFGARKHTPDSNKGKSGARKEARNRPKSLLRKALRMQIGTGSNASELGTEALGKFFPSSPATSKGETCSKLTRPA